MEATYREVTVLVVDDDDVDVEGIRRAFRKRRIGNRLKVAGDGLDALEQLRGSGNHTEPLPRPLLVLLDINMPRMNGLEFLREIRADDALRDLVVFVLTTSADQGDLYEAYNLNVAGYMLKSEVGESFRDAVDLIEHYWRIVEMPAT